MRKFSFNILLASFTGLLIQCKDAASRQEYSYIPLQDYVYTPITIAMGTELQLLAFSGGKESDKDNTYYYQFLTLNKSTGDTVRILAPLICVDSETPGISKTYTTPLQFDPEKGITTAYFQPKDSSQNLLMQVNSLVKDGKADTAVNIKALMEGITANEKVVINKSMPEFQNPVYPATVGILYFKEMPW